MLGALGEHMHTRSRWIATSLVLATAWAAVAAPEAESVPPHDQNSSFFALSNSDMWEHLKAHGGVAVIGLKARGANRGTWKGKTLISPAERAHAESVIRASPDATLIWSDPRLPIVHVQFPDIEAMARHRTLPHVEFLEPPVTVVQFASSSSGCWD